MRVDAVVFDLDQTLFDHEGSARAGLTRWLRGQDVEPTAELLAAWFDAEERHTAAWRAGQCSWAEQRRRRLRDILPLIGQHAGNDDELDEVFTGYLSEYEAAWAAFEDAAPCVAALQARGLRLVMLTNGAEEQQLAKLAAIGLADAFDPVLTPEALGYGKPDPRAYQAVCDALDLPPSRCVYVGDNYELDSAAPRAFGMHAIHLDRAAARDPDAGRISSLDQLPDLLEPQPETEPPPHK